MFHIEALPTDLVTALRQGGPDANGMPAERAISDGQGNPCRHCLQQIPAGAAMLICAHRPFSALQPYAETGPIFLCAGDCPRYAGPEMPPVAQTSPDYLMKGYWANERIYYGTGRVTPKDQLATYAATLFTNPDVAFVDVRSARNNCFQFRLRRTPGQ